MGLTTDKEETITEVPLSAIQHWKICPRRCALIHVAGIWEENLLTVEGHLLHERVHNSAIEHRPGVKIATGLRLFSKRLGLTGQADVVEFPKEAPPFPVEYKRGKPKNIEPYTLQLCAQAMCLEEMLNVKIPGGALYFGTARKRLDVPFSSELRTEVEAAVQAIREILVNEWIPKVPISSICKSCSLSEFCAPSRISVQKYLQAAVETEC